MIVLDAGVLIAYSETHDPHHKATIRFLAAHADERFSVPVITLSEALVRPASAEEIGSALKKIMPLGLDVEDLREQDAVALARVRAATGLKMPDALVIHTAERYGGSVATTDARLAAAAESRGLVVHQI
jgi:predicted nucleic acid-binding protein